jgi:tetratricopeptide (TPR) repeat protein
MEGMPPYAPFVEIFEGASRKLPPDVLASILGRSAPEIARLAPGLKSLFPDLPPPLSLPAGQERHFLFNNVCECLDRLSRVQPLLLVIEDLHWADEPSLLLLRHVAQHLEAIPVLMVTTCRDTDMDAHGPLSVALEDLIRRRKLNRHFLKALSRDDVKSMLEALGGRPVPDPVTDAIHSLTEGNPFFVEEVFDHLAERGTLFNPATGWVPSFSQEAMDVPQGVRLVIGRRLQALSARGGRALNAAAVIGRSFSFELLSAVADVGAGDLLDATDEAERAHLVTSSSRGGEAVFSFKHAIVRETLLQTISRPRRQQLHLRVADALEASLTGNANRVSDLAYHLCEAGSFAQPSRAARYLKLAGDMSLDAAGFEEALRLYDRAGVLHACEAEEQADLLYRRGLALRGLSRWDELMQVWSRALALYDGCANKEGAARVCHDLALLMIWGARYAEAHTLCARGLELLGEEMSPLKCRLLARGAIGQAGDGNYGGSSAMISQSLEMALRLGDPQLRAQVLSHKAICHFGFMETRGQLEAGLASLELLGPSGNPWEICEAMWNTQGALLYAGRLDEVSRMGAELERLSLRVGHFGARWTAERCAGMRDLLITADFAAFEHFARRDLEVIQTAAKPLVSHSYAWLGLAQFWSGRWREAGESFETALLVEVPVFTAGVAWALLFVWKCYMGEREAAMAMYREKRRDSFPDRRQRPTGKWSMLFGMIEGLAVLGHREEAASLYPLVCDALETGTLLRFQAAGFVETVAGIGAACASLWDRAEAHYGNALRQAESIPHRVEQAEVRRWLARMLLDRNEPGDSRRARLLASEAVQLYGAMAMSGHLKLVEDMVGK